MKIDGRCHCGCITYEAEIDPAKVMICHCTDCQTLSGSAFRTVAFSREGTFKLLSGGRNVLDLPACDADERLLSAWPDHFREQRLPMAVTTRVR